jgi:hypothetical protein
MAPSCIVIPVPEAEPAVDLLRRTHTRDGAEGMPAHITLIYPFADDAILTARLANDARDVIAHFAPFDFQLTSVERFTHPTEGHVWLAPNPASNFVDIVRAFEDAFPEYPSFAGEFDDVIPHLTVVSSASEETLASVEDQLADSLPIDAHALVAYLMVHGDGRWQKRSEFSLGAAAH